MRRKRLTLAVALPVLVGMLGAGLVALAQVGSDALLRQYEARLAKIDKNKGDDLHGLAKWCYQNDLLEQAMKHALEAHAKAPEDVRPKYLIYILTQGPEAGEVVGVETPRVPAATISEERVRQVFKREGRVVMRRFKEVQGILLSRCGSPKCHGGASKEGRFVLIRQALRSDKTLAQNFLAIDGYLNRERPEESRLLMVPVRGRDAGHPTRSIRSTRAPIFRTIAAWIDSLKTEGDRIWTEDRPPEILPPFAEDEM